ncbi:MAG: hypothetical protein U0525_03110 [Patescibacteria group bacterium]
MICTKCNIVMLEGYELMPTKIGYMPKLWVNKLEDKKFLGIGMKVPDMKNAVTIKTFRCPSCGSLVDEAK